VQGSGGGAWQAQAPRAGTNEGADSGWTLVVIATDPSAPVGQAVVVDGAQVVSAAAPSFNVPLDGLFPAGAVAGIQTVTWNGYGGGSQPALTSTRQTLTANASVQLSGGAQPYLVGVVAATTSADSTRTGPPPDQGWPGNRRDGGPGGLSGYLGWPDDDGCGLLGYLPGAARDRAQGAAGQTSQRAVS